jgi:thiosulfate/3-mercaptopyruvate sulfurtransferase
MNLKISILAVIAIASLTWSFKSISGPKQQDPWKKEQLLEPADLAKTINDPKATKPLIYSIGPGGNITGSKDIGPTREKAGLDKLKSTLEKLPKNSDIVIYCGCCPFEHCPNIRPAFNLLKDMGFSNYKLLNLSHNLKTDWIDKGFPVSQ